MATFAWEIQFWATVAQFEEYLALLPRPAWVRGITVHHTSKPTIEQWAGRRSMESLGYFYQYIRGWDAGPHLFIGPDGIWQGTPLTRIGVHAQRCNSTHLGMEVVGDYSIYPWQDPIRALAFGTLKAIINWLGVGTSSINCHRDCVPRTECPGTAIQMKWIRDEVNTLLHPTPTDDAMVLGVGTSLSLSAWRRALLRNEAPILDIEMPRVYDFCRWLDIDPAFVFALWLQHSGRPLGVSQEKTRNPLNLKHGDELIVFESFQLGLFAGILYLKNTYGAGGKLNLRSIIPLELGEDAVATAIPAIIQDMLYMRNN